MEDNPCSGDELTTATEESIKNLMEQMSIAKGKGLLTDDKYDEVAEQANAVREANKKLKCIVDSIPKEIVEPSDIIDEIREERESIKLETSD